MIYIISFLKATHLRIVKILHVSRALFKCEENFQSE